MAPTPTAVEDFLLQQIDLDSRRRIFALESTVGNHCSSISYSLPEFYAQPGVSGDAKASCGGRYGPTDRGLFGQLQFIANLPRECQQLSPDDMLKYHS